MRAFGLKHTAREIAARNGVPLLPGSGLLASVEEALVPRTRIGYPVMLKSTAGGGGIGMRLCRDESGTAPRVRRRGASEARQLRRPRDSIWRNSCANARHIEVQIFGDGTGKVVALGERDCSAQRRNQKVIEETPAPGFPTRVARRAVRRRPAAWDARCVSLRRHGRVHLRQRHRRLLLPGSEHAAAGGARRHRGSHRNRSGGVDGAAGGG